MLSTKNVICVILFTLFSFSAYGQATHGKLFTKSEAEQKFGPYKVSVGISTSLLDSLCGVTDSVLMFNLIKNQLVVLNNKRKILYSEGEVKIDKSTVFYYYSLPLIKELMKDGKNKLTYVETRDSVLTVGNGNLIMEYGTICPPYCSTE